MGWLRRLFGLAVVAAQIVCTTAHGMMTEPAARNVVHNSNYCPHCLAAGGPGVTYANGRVWPNAEHGVCGDPAKGPLDHEAGGKFATAKITGTYTQGQRITIRVKITAPHGGRFSFGVCPVPDGASATAERKAVTQKCFDANSLTNAEDGSKYWWFGKKGVGEYTMTFVLPPTVSCKRCVLQWHYETGNSCTIPKTPPEHVMSTNMVSCDQSPNMEEFWNCADVSITSGTVKGVPKPRPKRRKETFTVVVDTPQVSITTLAASLAALALAASVSTALAVGLAVFAIVWSSKKMSVPNTWTPVASLPSPPLQRLPWLSFGGSDRRAYHRCRIAH